MHPRLRTDFVPDGLEPHPNDSIKVFELSISDIEILKIEILRSALSPNAIELRTKE